MKCCVCKMRCDVFSKRLEDSSFKITARRLERSFANRAIPILHCRFIITIDGSSDDAWNAAFSTDRLNRHSVPRSPNSLGFFCRCQHGSSFMDLARSRTRLDTYSWDAGLVDHAGTAAPSTFAACCLVQSKCRKHWTPCFSMCLPPTCRPSH